MLTRPHSASIPTAQSFRDQLANPDVKDKAAVVTELTRAVYAGDNATFSLMVSSEQLPYLELLRDVAGSPSLDGISRNNAFTALNGAARAGIEGAAALRDESIALLPKMPKPAGKSAGEESQVVSAAVVGMHLADWVKAGRPTERKAKAQTPKPDVV